MIACNQKPAVPISNTLEIALDSNLTNYVELLNSSFKGDTLSLSEFLKIDYIYGAASYDHGEIVLQVLEKLGDEKFNNTVLTLSNKQQTNLKMYILTGMDRNDSLFNASLSEKFKKTFLALDI